jgi:hypothetical protein
LPGGNLLGLDHDMSGAPNDPQFAFQYTAAHEVISCSLPDADYLWQATGDRERHLPST